MKYIDIHKEGVIIKIINIEYVLYCLYIPDYAKYSPVYAR